MNFVPRSEWGARPPKNTPTPLPGASTGIALHHEGDGLDPPTDCYAKMRSTQRYHMDSKGWNDIAYSWGVGCGLIFEGRGWGIQDGADTGAGKLMHSVVWLGDSSVATPSDEDLIAINIVLEEQANHGAPTIVGHRDINSTDCPGDALYSWLQAGRPIAAPPAPNPTRKQKPMPWSIVRLNDGRLCRFTTYMGVVVHSWQTAPNSGPWSPYAGLRNEGSSPGAFDSVVAAVNADGRCEVIAWHSAYGVAFTCWQEAEGGQWSGWVRL